MRILLALLGGGLFASQAMAAALLDEPFNYAPGMLIGQTNPASGQTWDLVAPDTGINVSPPTVISGSLSHPDLAPSIGNSAATNRTQSGVARIELATVQTAGTVFYSALFRVNDLAGLTNTTTGSFFAGLNASAGPGMNMTTAGAALLIHLDADNPLRYNLGIATSTDNLDRVFDNTTELAAGETVFIVASYTFNPATNDDVARLWINPDPDTFGVAFAPTETIMSLGSVSAAADSTQLASFFLRNNAVEPAQIQVDEVRVDNSWDQVTPVPEPGAIIFLAIAAAGFGTLHRGRRKC